jgi:putative tryptophan/tyrosine transport system substrate-binding protein
VKRREFIGLLGGAAAWPLTASAQRAEGKLVTIGILALEPWPSIDAFRHALDARGYIEGKNVRFVYRYAKGHHERLPELANELVGLNVDVIFTWRTDAVLAAKQATATIPIVMGVIGDPIGSGIVTNLARPGGNITGCSLRVAELEGKRLELLKEVVPGLSRVAILLNPTNHYMLLVRESVRKDAEVLHLSLAFYEVYDTITLDAAFVTLTKDRPNAFLVPADTFPGEPAQPHRAVRDREQTALHLYFPRVHRGRRTDRLCAQLSRPVSAGGELCGQDPEGRQAGRASDRAAEYV